ncbi:Predicted RNA binding protein, contains G-patch and Zn-finger domains [Phaffia rhodozyma]|uniref:Predicted RNA binding protein, contains G-patch and Zn-finger domains n=1 Tax=Phaffia rhodozyma TaxID=264483 RepID=A0A0F7SI70_PHARH|nr:Predicted RNA binding protein, contains G-patch and Zn-finger domains [Phaffia rhodozyma]
MPLDVNSGCVEDSEEEDFMSDAFLAKILPPATTSKRSTQSTSYNDKRKQAQRASEARNKANAPKSFRQLREDEEERRKEGLKKSLFEKEQEAGQGPSKALKMMMNMGFSVGDSLGKQSSGQSNNAISSTPADRKEALNKAENTREHTHDSEEEEGISEIGCSKRRKIESQVGSDPEPEPTVMSTSKAKIEPLGIKLWAGRKGLGAQPKASLSPSKPRASDTVSPVVPLDAYAYRSRQQIEYEERKAESQLRSARKTVIELDERSNRGFSILHLDPSYLPSFPPPLLEYLTAPLSADETESGSVHRDAEDETVQAVPGFEPGTESDLDRIRAERLKKQMEADSLGPLKRLDWTDDDGEDDKPIRVGKSADPERNDKEENKDGEDGEGENWAVLAGEAKKWVVLPALQRLLLTHDYLRSEFSYCIFCGFAYDSSEQMDRECPGLTEEDHD